MEPLTKQMVPLPKINYIIINEEELYQGINMTQQNQNCVSLNMVIVQRRVSLDGSDVIQKSPKLGKLAKLAKLANVQESVKQYAFVCRTVY